MTRVSASGVERQLACPGSAHLPQTEYHTADAESGNERHGDAEVAALIGDLEGLPWQVRKLLEPGDVFATECAMAYDVSDDTSRALGHIQWRDYSGLRPFEIPMTLDLIIHGARRTIYIDYKGYKPVTSADRNPQLLTGALAVARASGRDEITVAIVYLGASWRPADVAVLSVFDLDSHAAVLREMVASVDRTLNVGPHCEYCHAFVARDGKIQCPEQRKIAEEAGGGAIAVRVEAMIPFENDDDAADAHELLDRIKLVAKRLSAALYARAAERPIPLRNGKMFGPYQKLGDREYDGKMVHAVTIEVLGREIADQVVEMVASQAQFERVVKPIAAKGKFAATKRAVFETVDKRGGMKQKPTTTIGEYDPGLRLVDAESKEVASAPEVADAPF